MKIIIFLSLIPVFIWALMSPLESRFLDLNYTTTSLGQIFGLVGMTLFAINLILAGRFKFLDKYFNGLDKVYLNHGRIGSIAFSMILFHPLFLVVQYIDISTRAAALFFVPFVNMQITWGIISLLMMIVLISFTFYVKLKYHIWKMSHKFMIVAFFFAVLHTFTISSDISRNSFLKYYILTLSILGLIVSIRQAVLNNFLVKKFKYKVAYIKQLNPDVLEVGLTPTDKSMKFKVGQFAFFSFINKSGVPSESHPFSLSSSEVEENLTITIKNLGDYTSLLKNLKDGDTVFIDGPYGQFSYKNVSSKNQIWIAGGIGITPFYSMAKSLEDGYNIDFYYSVKEKDEAVYVEELNKVSSKNPNFKFNLWSAKEKGYINAELVAGMSNGLEDKEIFFCGPPALMKSLKDQFVLLGVDVKKIHYENFSFN